MSQVIVYQIPGQPVAIVRPCGCGLTLEQIGQKDVPAGTPFWIVDAASIPEDRTFRNNWELDTSGLGLAAGTGGTYQPEVEA